MQYIKKIFLCGYVYNCFKSRVFLYIFDYAIFLQTVMKRSTNILMKKVFNCIVFFDIMQ